MPTVTRHPNAPTEKYYWIDETPEPIEITIAQCAELSQKEEFLVSISRSSVLTDGMIRATDIYGSVHPFINLTDMEIVKVLHDRYKSDSL